MDKDQLEFVCKINQYLEGGTKEACVKIREFLKYAKKTENQIYSPLSCISNDEFIEAVKVLMASAFNKEDEVPETWNCDNDCRKVNYLLCPGECNIYKEASKMCPFYECEEWDT